LKGSQAHLAKRQKVGRRLRRLIRTQWKRGSKSIQNDRERKSETWGYRGGVEFLESPARATEKRETDVHYQREARADRRPTSMLEGKLAKVHAQ